jgi:hypothetical protein
LGPPHASALAGYELARLEGQKGNVEAARKYYRRYLDHWGETDIPIVEVEKARVRLRELGSPGRW